MWMLFVAAIVVIGVIAGLAQAKALRLAKEVYEAALAALSGDPQNNDCRVAALHAGRRYAELARAKAGSKGVAIFDEVAMQNDLTARLGTRATTATAPETAAVPALVDRIAKLTELANLRDKGVLTPAEFEAEKRKLLAS